MVKRLKIYQKDLNGSENRGLDWRSDGRKSTAFEDQTVVQGRKFRGGTDTEKRLTFVRQSVHSFRVSVAEKFSPNGFNRDLIFSFFCIKTKGQRNKSPIFIGQDCFFILFYVKRSINGKFTD
jgi:hypothetical protein